MKLLLLLLLACPKKAPVPAMNDEAVAGVTDPALRILLHDHWEDTLAHSPVWATMLGDHRFDDQLGDNDPAARAAARARRDAFLARARDIDATTLGEEDATTHALFVESLEIDQQTDICRSEEWNVSPRWTPLQTANHLQELEISDDDLEARYRQLPKSFEDSIANLRVGLADGYVGNAESIQRTVEMLDRQLEKPTAEWQMKEMDGVVENEVRPAVARYRDFLRDTVLPEARPPEKAGMSALPNGAACYDARIRQFTTLPKTADELHQTGLDELKRIHAYMSEIGERVYGTSDIAEIFEKLRTDESLYFQTEEEVEQKAVDALAKAKAAIPEYFGRLPQADCIVERVPDFEAPYTTIAYYRPPVPGEKPGSYFINVYEPKTRPRHEAEVLAYHESIPGHHLQIAISQELPALPAFRRHDGQTAYVEGWGLYSEQLADEMGLYSGDTDRLGMGSFEAWRASRLVVDTGLHAKGWTREQAVQFMLKNTPLAENNIRNEVDRYLTTPGQALAYKTGQIEIWRLRRKAEAELGDGFVLKDFHDVVLGGGAVSLPVLDARVSRWIEDVRAGRR